MNWKKVIPSIGKDNFLRVGDRTMHHAETMKEKIKLFMIILWPILVTQVSVYAMNMVDTMMSGRYGTEDLAGVAIGSSLWVPVFIGFSGILLAIIPIVSQFLGGGQREEVAESVTQSLYLSMFLAIVVVVLGVLFLDPILSLMNLEQAVEHIAKNYLIGLSVGIIPLMSTNVVRNFFDAHGYTKIMMVITLVAVPFNVVLNYGLIFGKLGFPELGGVGAGYATAITYWLIFIISVWMTFKIKALQVYQLFVKWFVPSLKIWKEQLAIGIPIGLSIFFEVSIFAAVTLLIGKMFDTVTIAAHQAAFSFTSMIFMMPLSISFALTITVGFSVGGGRFSDANQYMRLGVLSSIGILVVCSFFLYVFREQIAYLYTDNPDVVALAVMFIIYAIFFQLSDAVQSALQGVLRGYKDVTIPFVISLISYWGIGLPSGYLLADFTDLGAYGFWVGITIGLTCAAVGFTVRLSVVQKKPIYLHTRDDMNGKNKP